MTIDFDNEPKHEFAKTMVQAIISVIAAVIVGCLLGDSIEAFLGTNMEYEVSNRYTERMNATVTWFVDDMDPLTDENGMELTDENGDPVLGVYFQRVAQALSGQGDVKILRTAAGDAVLAADDGPVSIDEYYDADMAQYIRNLLEAPDLSDTEDAMTSEPIDDVLLYNIAVEGERVYFYIFYDDYGFLSIAYDPTGALDDADDVENLLADAGWYIVFDYEVD